MIHLALALRTVHAMDVLHRDLRSQNVFLDSTGSIKVGDFGVSDILRHREVLGTGLVGTAQYAAPEIYSGKPYSAKSDIWALGVILYECCTGKRPFTASSSAALAANVLRGDRGPISATKYR
jgi:NIMA (never in mitosis gene a)-related kinase 1/4/5